MWLKDLTRDQLLFSCLYGCIYFLLYSSESNSAEKEVVSSTKEDNTINTFVKQSLNEMTNELWK